MLERAWDDVLLLFSGLVGQIKDRRHASLRRGLPILRPIDLVVDGATVRLHRCVERCRALSFVCYHIITPDEPKQEINVTIVADVARRGGTHSTSHPGVLQRYV